MGCEPRSHLASKSMWFSYCCPVSCTESGLGRVSGCLPGLRGILSGFTRHLEAIRNSTSSNCPALESLLHRSENTRQSHLCPGVSMSTNKAGAGSCLSLSHSKARRQTRNQLLLYSMSPAHHLYPFARGCPQGGFLNEKISRQQQ